MRDQERAYELLLDEYQTQSVRFGETLNELDDLEKEYRVLANALKAIVTRCKKEDTPSHLRGQIWGIAVVALNYDPQDGDYADPRKSPKENAEPF